MKKHFILALALALSTSAHAVEFNKLSGLVNAAQNGVAELQLLGDSVKSVDVSQSSEKSYTVIFTTQARIGDSSCSRKIKVGLIADGQSYSPVSAESTTCN